jgi:hypothetical protein
MTNQQIAQKGFEASQVLDNPAYKAAMEALRAEVIEAWKKCHRTCPGLRRAVRGRPPATHDYEEFVMWIETQNQTERWGPRAEILMSNPKVNKLSFG